jgi:outer membrane beta-barrel protein
MLKKLFLIFGYIFFLTFFFTFIHSKNLSASTDTDEEYNFSWLDPDKKIYVLQNRKYRKASKPAVFLSGGINLTNPYKTETLVLPRVSYWFLEQAGIEIFYAKSFSKDNDQLTALRNISASALPFVREHRSYYGAVFSWVPWYAKLNFFNKILYLDWAINLGLGSVETAFDQNNKANLPPNYKIENLTAVFFGTSQNYFLNKNFSVRLDLIGMTYKALGADNISSVRHTNFDFVAGLGYTF